MSKLTLIISLFFLSFYVSAQNVEKSISPKSESVQDSTKRFSLADGKYVGVNPNPPKLIKLKDTGIQKNKDLEESKAMNLRRFNLETGKDTGVGAEFRSERYRSLENRNRTQKAIPKPNPQSDTLSRQRIILQDGKYVGAGPKKSKDQ